MLPIGTSKMYLYVKTTRVGKKTYRYLILEQYVSKNENKGKPKRIPILKLPVDEAIKLLLMISSYKSIREWCGGWDLNPRRPTPSGPKPDPFVLARAPPHSYIHVSTSLVFIFYLFSAEFFRFNKSLICCFPRHVSFLYSFLQLIYVYYFRLGTWFPYDVY